ncbi:MAG: dUTP diphosphatase [Eubacterium aggregans]|uniref:Deoxyuridine 5'-triphosphate nucleotidohydrolase n=1 Tax=Eubacterium aggregans TaxID=81409 RepID=A0A1H3ZQC0_9FIRM|nr:dUTP diphosphatase [Eubacterium aggregans]MDD4691953.1 dUTP diphosphatase [Eubacterium aggregans]MEA5073913.1 dUTP diphosphatase [Eubacterium aggregans]SEA25805.1 dUTP pyrophosphatase [Eubacterium aggregans]
METCVVKIYNGSKNPLPRVQSQGAAGVDLHADLAAPLVLEPHKVYAVPTGIRIELPLGYEAQVRARSGLALKHGITLVNGIGTIDSDYRGEIAVIVMNLLDTPFTITPGDRIAQMVVTRVSLPEFVVVESPEALEATQRGDGGFGHSGV